MENNYGKITSYRDLDVYKRAYKMSIIVCRDIVPKLPKEERFDLIDQLRRSSKAVPRLIAEGYAKKHQNKGFQKYIDDAMAEANETAVGLCHVRDLYPQYINSTLCQKLVNQYDIIGKQLYKLRESWCKFK
jgi:four helix bundle protein